MSKDPIAQFADLIGHLHKVQEARDLLAKTPNADLRAEVVILVNGGSPVGSFTLGQIVAQTIETNPSSWRSRVADRLDARIAELKIELMQAAKAVAES